MTRDRRRPLNREGRKAASREDSAAESFLLGINTLLEQVVKDQNQDERTEPITYQLPPDFARLQFAAQLDYTFLFARAELQCGSRPKIYVEASFAGSTAIRCV